MDAYTGSASGEIANRILSPRSAIFAQASAFVTLGHLEVWKNSLTRKVASILDSRKAGCKSVCHPLSVLVIVCLAGQTYVHAMQFSAELDGSVDQVAFSSRNSRDLLKKKTVFW